MHREAIIGLWWRNVVWLVLTRGVLVIPLQPGIRHLRVSNESSVDFTQANATACGHRSYGGSYTVTSYTRFLPQLLSIPVAHPGYYS